MRVIISAGGTGGHIYPALEILNEIKKQEPKSEFLYVGTTNRMEKDIVPALNIPYLGIEMYGLQRKLTLKNFKSITCLFKAVKIMRKKIKEFKPDVVIGVGGYVTAPVIYAAAKEKTPTFIHEQNTELGLANKFLKRKVTKIGVSMEESLKKIGDKAVLVGNPAGDRVVNSPEKSKKDFNLDPNKKTVLFVMGSLGSGSINNKMENIFKDFKNKPYEVLFATGEKRYQEFKKIKVPKNVKITPYIYEMGSLLKIVDLFITRSGATTLAEITRLGVPTILVPSRAVANDEQIKNAKLLANKNAAILLEEQNFNSHNLLKNIDDILNNKKLREELIKEAKKAGIKDSSKKIYNELKKIINDK